MGVADRAGGDGAGRGAAAPDDAVAGDVNLARNTPRVLGSPQGSEYGDIVAVDGEIVAWLEQHLPPAALMAIGHPKPYIGG
jgi:hypothetical protein